MSEDKSRGGFTHFFFVLGVACVLGMDVVFLSTKTQRILRDDLEKCSEH